MNVAQAQLFIVRGVATPTASPSPTAEEFRLTSFSPRFQSGRITSKFLADLTQDQIWEMEMSFGSSDLTGGQGIAFMLHNVTCPSSIPILDDDGFGVAGTLNSFTIEFDTFDNGSSAARPEEIPQDHIAFFENGDRFATGSIGGPAVTASSTGANIEDGNYHDVRIEWDYISAASQTISVYFDNVLRKSYTGDMITQQFNGDTAVQWSVGGSTGISTNGQTVRFPNPKNFLPVCVGDQITLTAPQSGSSFVWNVLTPGTFQETLTISPLITFFGVSYIDYCGIGQNILYFFNILPTNLTIDDFTGCEDDNPTLEENLSAAHAPYIFAWTVPAGVVNPGNSNSLVATESGLYTLQVTSAQGCVISKTVTITLNAPPVTTPIIEN